MSLKEPPCAVVFLCAEERPPASSSIPSSSVAATSPALCCSIRWRPRRRRTVQSVRFFFPPEHYAELQRPQQCGDTACLLHGCPLGAATSSVCAGKSQRQSNRKRIPAQGCMALAVSPPVLQLSLATEAEQSHQPDSGT